MQKRTVSSSLYDKVMDLSVIICSRNRAASLARVLASAAEMDVQGITWELLIVDNGTGDDVEKTVACYKAQLPLRMESEPKPGLSRARNCGVMNARGKYIFGPMTTLSSIGVGCWLTRTQFG